MATDAPAFSIHEWPLGLKQVTSYMYFKEEWTKKGSLNPDPYLIKQARMLLHTDGPQGLVFSLAPCSLARSLIHYTRLEALTTFPSSTAFPNAAKESD